MGYSYNMFQLFVHFHVHQIRNKANLQWILDEYWQNLVPSTLGYWSSFNTAKLLWNEIPQCAVAYRRHRAQWKNGTSKSPSNRMGEKVMCSWVVKKWSLIHGSLARLHSSPSECSHSCMNFELLRQNMQFSQKLFQFVIYVIWWKCHINVTTSIIPRSPGARESRESQWNPQWCKLKILGLWEKAGETAVFVQVGMPLPKDTREWPFQLEVDWNSTILYYLTFRRFGAGKNWCNTD